jgi:type IV secretory pathway TraG/TraD family ATPase VirD4
MAAMWGAATRKVIGAGVDSPRLARDLATLVGQHDVPVRSVSYADGRASEQISLRRQDILEPAAIRALPPGTALLLATGGRPALISLLPWYESRDADRIQACRDRLERLIAEGAAR